MLKRFCKPTVNPHHFVRLPGLTKNVRCLQGAALVASLMIMAGCAPNVKPPQFHPRDNVPLAGLPTGKAGWPSPEWWKSFNDPQLNGLIAKALANSPSVEQAEARYNSALSSVNVERANQNAKITAYGDAGLTHSHLHLNDEGINDSTHSNNGSLVAGAEASWDLDLWGKQRAAVASRIGQAHAAEAEQAAAYNSIENSITTTYFDWQTLQAQLKIARKVAASNAHILQLTQARVSHGLDDPQTLDSSKSDLASARLNVAELEGQAAIDKAQLAAIVGVSPAELADLKAQPLPTINAQLPGDASLNLLGRRPDIVAKRWQIESSLQDINEARAAYYPDVSLNALGGFLQLYPNLHSSGHANALVGNIGPSISLPIFSGGRLKAQFNSAQAELDANVASYNNTVVQAAQDISKQVLTLQQQGQEEVQQQQQVDAITHKNQLIAYQRRQGLIDDRTYYQGQIQLDQQLNKMIQLKGSQLSTHIALINALGGGYQNSNAPALPASNKREH